MTAKKRIDVFISSTSFDLPEHRKKVIEAITTKKCHPLGMEYWAVSGQDPVELCRKHVFDSEIFIGIYAYRYGWCPPGHGGKSITEMEYDWAGEVMRDGKPIPCLCFIMDKSHPITADMMEADKQKELDAFKARVKTKHVGFFKNADDLKAQVLAALAEVLPEIEKADAKCNLVPKPERFVGRKLELKRLQESLNAGKSAVAITALHGLGGIGKSTLVKAFAQQDGHFGLKLWAELGQRSREDLLRDILPNWVKQLEGRDLPQEASPAELLQAARDVVERVTRDGCGEPVLMVIDNVWANTVEVAQELQALVTALDARVLVTTRSEGVAADLDCQNIELETLNKADGAALMIDLIEHPRAADSRAELEALSEQLGGHALALKLAARWLRTNFQKRKVTQLTDNLRRGLVVGEKFKKLRLEKDEKDAGGVTATLQLSYDALGGNDAALKAKRQAQFRALGALPPDLSFRAAHAYALWGEEDADGLDTLAADALLTPDAAREDWYSQHRLLRAYARALLREAGEFEDVTARHWIYLIMLAHRVFAERRHQLETWGELDEDLPQIHTLGNELAALMGIEDETEQDTFLQVFRETGESDVDEAILFVCERFGSVICPYVNERYIGSEGRYWLRAALEAARALGHQESVRLFMNELGYWHYQHGELTTSIIYHEQALEVAIELDDKRGIALALNSLGLVHNDLGNQQIALTFYDQALSLRRQLADKRGGAVTLNNLGLAYTGLGDNQQGLEYLEQALMLHRDAGDKNREATTLNNLGNVYAELDDKHKALEYFEQALILHREAGDKGNVATTLNNLGSTYADLGEKHKALEYFEQALTLRREIDNKRNVAQTLHNLGAVYSSLGEKAKALEYFGQALPLFQQVGDKRSEVATLNNLGSLYDDLGNEHKALEYYTQVLPLFREMGDKLNEAATLNNLGKVAADLGNKRKAQIYFEQGLGLTQQLGNKRGEATTLNNLGAVYSKLGDRKALDYLEQALALSRQLNDKRGEAATLNNLGKLYEDLGNKHKALEYYTQTLQLLQEVGDKGDEATALNNLGLIYDDLGDKHKALAYYTQALPLRREAGDSHGEAITCYKIALVLWEQDERESALTYMQTAREICIRTGIDPSNPEEWITFMQRQMKLDRS